MFETLQNGLAEAVKSIRGKGKLTEANMRTGLSLVEQSLLEADVSYGVVQDFMDRVSEKALGEKVLGSLKPHEQLVGIVHKELVELLGPVDPEIPLKSGVTVLMLCGLQGSGKTTTCGKLARLLQNQKHRPLMVAADLQRPAAIDQLHVIGEQLGVPVYSEKGAADPVKVCQAGVKMAQREDADVVILDTAGRLAIDEELMDQLKRIDRKVGPHQAYLVVDGMTGQDAVNSAKAFNESLELDGVVMTKLDGDARGGALLSVKHVTGVPIKFIGTGEKLDALEQFRPEGMAGRILGQGDILALVEQVQDQVDRDTQQQLEEQLKKGEFTLEHFKTTLQQVAKPGLMSKMMSLMPGMGELRNMMQDEDTEGGVNRMIGLINSMTPAERENPKLIDTSRRTRIAKGAGVEPQEVNQLVKQFEPMAAMMKGMAGASAKDRMAAAQQLSQSGALQSGRMPKMKQGTGKRLKPKERAKLKKQREKEERRRRREEKSRRRDGGS